MRNTRSSPSTALSNAVDAWKSKARESFAPVLRHVISTISSLQRIGDVIRQVDDIDRAVLIGNADDVPDHAETLDDLCFRMDRLQEVLARLDEDARAASREGESLVEAFLALTGHDAPLTQASEQPGGESTRIVSQIELQSVQEFLQNAPLASIPVNASYYQRILEAANSPEGHRVPMGKILTAAGVITDLQLQSALDSQRKGRRRALGNVLVELGYTTEDAIAQALAAQLALPYILLGNEPISTTAVATIPVHMARRHACFPLNFTGHALCVAMANPLDLIALEDLRIAARNHIRPCVATRSDIVRHIERYYL